MRLGFPVKAIGREGLKSNDARRHQSGPHLRVSLGYISEILDYLSTVGIRMYRISSDIAPYITHPDLPQFHRQIDEAAEELAAVGAQARRLGIRLSMHPAQFIVLNSPDQKLVQKSVADLLAAAEILDRMEQGPEAVLVIHVGGTYGDHTSGCDRWVETYATLPEPVKRRLVLENDDLRYSAADVLDIHARTGVPLVFDNLHFACNNPERLDMGETLTRFLATWPEGVTPKTHFSSPDTNFRTVERRDRKTGKLVPAILPPVWTGHADFLNPFEFIDYVRRVAPPAVDFDIMLEAKAKDVALLRLQRDIARYAPDLAPRFGLNPDAPDPADDTIVAEIEAAAGGD
jgi:UV DNA damage endonuclease